jgi:hypothetical protein
MTQNQINYWRLQEEKRSHLATESETQRSNLAKEAENYRSNLAKETETHRSNVVNEGVAFGNLNESVRSHTAQEDIANRELSELMRHQLVTEAETNRSNIARELENYRHNSAVEAETRRANIVYETLEGTRQAENALYHQQTLAEQKRQNNISNDLRKREINKDPAPSQIIYVNNPRFRGEGGGVGTSQQLIEKFGNLIDKGAGFLLPGN